MNVVIPMRGNEDHLSCSKRRVNEGLGGGERGVGVHEDMAEVIENKCGERERERERERR